MRNRISILKYFFLAVWSIIVVGVPLWMVIINSLKPLREANKLELKLPEQWSFSENYIKTMVEGEYFKSFLNTLLVTVVSVVLILVIGSLAAWVFARAKSKTVSVFYYISIAGVLVPPAIITSIKLLKEYNIHGTYIGLIVFYISYLLAFSIFFTTGFVKTIPIELEEAAKIDGSTQLGLFFRIVFPLLKVSLIKTAILLVLIIWSDFYYAFYILGGGTEMGATLNMSLYTFASSYMFQTNWNLIFSGVVLASLPLLVFYIIGQRQIVSGIMSGATKG